MLKPTCTAVKCRQRACVCNLNDVERYEIKDDLLMDPNLTARPFCERCVVSYRFTRTILYYRD